MAPTPKRKLIVNWVLVFVYVFGVGAARAYLSVTDFGVGPDRMEGDAGLLQVLTSLVWPLWLVWRAAGYVGRAFV